MTTESAEAAVPAQGQPGFRIRWGWFLGCVAFGLLAILVGWYVTAPAGRTSYLADVLAGVGTTLLLVGIVVLLERRIVDSAVRRFRNAAEEARARLRDDLRAEVRDYTRRVNAEWAAAAPEDVPAVRERTKRLTEEFADSYTDEVLGAYDVEKSPER